MVPHYLHMAFFFLDAYIVWIFSLMFLFSGHSYWQELIEFIVWAYNKGMFGIEVVYLLSYSCYRKKAVIIK